MMVLRDLPETLEIIVVPGVTIRVQTLTTLDIALARAFADSEYRKVKDSYDVALKSGVAVAAEKLDLSRPDHQAGLYRVKLIERIAVKHIVGWTGIVDGDGQAVAPSEDAILRVLNIHPIAETFYERLMAAQLDLLAAKKD